MNTTIEKGAGIALLIGAVLMLSTMLIHPTGGSLHHLVRVARMTVLSHSMALLAVPFLGVGFWGLTRNMGTDRLLPLLSFSVMLMGLIAGMMAATINGLALPIYLQNYPVPTAEVSTSMRPILKNNIALNQAFDYVFLGAVSLSILLWSICIVTQKKLPHWIGYLGLVLSAAAIIMLASGFVFVSLHGFRLFVFSSVVWIVFIGFALLRSNKKEDRTTDASLL